MLLSLLFITSPAHDVLPIVWTDYTYNSEHGIAEGIPLVFITQRLVPSGNHGYVRNLGRFLTKLKTVVLLNRFVETMIHFVPDSLMIL